jgi:hypothetical protein
MSGIRLQVSAEISLMGVPRAFLPPEMNGSDNSESARGALTATVGIFLIFVADAFAQERASVAEVERIVVTGSNIPTAEEVGPNPVDTYRPADIEKLGIRNATDLQTFLPQEAGGTVNLNIGKRRWFW